MRLEIHFFKQSGKWYNKSVVDVPDCHKTFFHVSEYIRELHHKSELPGLTSGGKDFDVLVMGSEHPHGFPFISRAVNFLP